MENSQCEMNGNWIFRSINEPLELVQMGNGAPTNSAYSSCETEGEPHVSRVSDSRIFDRLSKELIEKKKRMFKIMKPPFLFIKLVLVEVW